MESRRSRSASYNASNSGNTSGCASPRSPDMNQKYCVRSPMGGDSYASPSVSPQPPADDDGVKVEVLQT